jgi:hypothetical protein
MTDMQTLNKSNSSFCVTNCKWSHTHKQYAAPKCKNGCCVKIVNGAIFMTYMQTLNVKTGVMLKL